MDIKEALNKAILLNMEDAARLVETLEAEGESENLRRAREDLKTWTAKAKERGLA